MGDTLRDRIAQVLFDSLVEQGFEYVHQRQIAERLADAILPLPPDKVTDAEVEDMAHALRAEQIAQGLSVSAQWEPQIALARAALEAASRARREG